MYSRGIYIYETETKTGPIINFILVAYLYETETKTGDIFKCILMTYLF
jgi:hypothetical protein